MTSNFYKKSTLSKEFNIKSRISSDSVRNILVQNGYTVYSMEQKGNQLVPYHTHPSEEMVIVLTGSVRYIIEEEIVDLIEGDIIKIKAGFLHAMVGINTDTVSNLLIIFT